MLFYIVVEENRCEIVEFFIKEGSDVNVINI